MDKQTRIHPTAIIADGAALGIDVTVGPYAVIHDDVQIGDGTRIAEHAVVYGGTEMGRECRIHTHAVVGGLPQDLAFEGGKSYVKIGDRSVIREGVTIHRGTKEGTITEVGDHCFLMSYSHLAHNVKLGNGVIVVNNALVAGYVEVGDNAFISGNAVIHQFCKIGRLAMVGGLSGIGKDVPPFCMTESTLRNVIAGLNVVGMRRAGMGPKERKEVKEAFRLLYHSGYNVSQAVEQIKTQLPEGPAQEFATFAEQSERGICPVKRVEGKA